MKDNFNKNFNIVFFAIFSLVLFSIYVWQESLESNSNSIVVPMFFLFIGAIFLYFISKSLVVSLASYQRQINFLKKNSNLSNGEIEKILSVFMNHGRQYFGVNFNESNIEINSGTTFKELNAGNEIVTLLNIVKAERMENFNNWKDENVVKFINENKYKYDLFSSSF